MVAGMLSFAWGGSYAATHPLLSVTWGSWTQYSQQEATWCWAAATKMMVDRVNGASPSECVLVQRGKGLRDCPRSVGSMTDLANALRLSGVRTDDVRAGVPSFETIRDQTVNSGGVMVRVERADSSHGHIAPIIGSRTDPDRVYLTYIRTGGVSGSWVDYSHFAAGAAGLALSTYRPTHYLCGGGG
jgi:hypothetical protein